MVRTAESCYKPIKAPYTSVYGALTSTCNSKYASLKFSARLYLSYTDHQGGAQHIPVSAMFYGLCRVTSRALLIEFNLPAVYPQSPAKEKAFGELEDLVASGMVWTCRCV